MEMFDDAIQDRISVGENEIPSITETTTHNIPPVYELFPEDSPMDYAVAQDTTGSELHDFTVVQNPKCVKSVPESVTPRKNGKSSVDPVTPHTKKKKQESNHKRNWRASSAISTAIKDNLTSYNIKDQGKVVLNTMKSSATFDLVKKEFQNPNKKTCGIRRTAGDTIKRIWYENSTVSNNQTSCPSKTFVRQ